MQPGQRLAQLAQALGQVGQGLGLWTLRPQQTGQGGARRGPLQGQDGKQSGIQRRQGLQLTVWLPQAGRGQQAYQGIRPENGSRRGNSEGFDLGVRGNSSYG
jgi:hypothetical protein